MANSNSSNSKPQFPISITGHARTAKGDQQALANARTALDHLQAKRKRLAEEKEKNEAAKDQGNPSIPFPDIKIRF